MQVAAVEMPKEEARKLYAEYRHARASEWSAEHRRVAQLAYQLKQGRKVVDVMAAMPAAGLTPEGHPKLAIAPAWAKSVRLIWWGDGSARMGAESRHGWRSRFTHVVEFPQGSWPFAREGFRSDLRAPTPLIPPRHLPRGQLRRNYWLLWEVEAWKPIPPRDPLLLRRLTERLFVVVAAWELTEVERLVLSGA